MRSEFFQKKSYILTKEHIPTLITVFMVGAAYLLHTVFMQTAWAWILWGITITTLALTRRLALSHMVLVVLGIGIMIMAPMHKEISFTHFITMSSGLFLSVAVPYFIAKKHFKHSLIHFDLDFHRKWTTQEIGYIVATVAAASFSLYIYFTTTDAYLNWPMDTPANTLIIFASIMVIGIWEEFFFIATVYGVLQRLLPYTWAIILQGILFTAFLYQMGFVGWIVPLVFVYTLVQAFIFHKTKTLLITLIIHILVDFGVFINLLLAAANA